MNFKQSWDLSTIPDDVFMSELGRRRAARRVLPTGGVRPGAGRKAIFVPCPKCSQLVTTTQARRGHGCQASVGCSSP